MTRTTFLQGLGQKLTARKPLTLERKVRRAGTLFMLPWIFGVLTFFVIPFGQTIIWSFNEISFAPYSVNFVGFDNYKYAIFEHTTFFKDMTETAIGMVTNTLIILIFSFFLAIILNQKFHGRGIARALFFLPVVVASSVVIQIIQQDVFTDVMMNTGNVSMFQTGGIAQLLNNVGLSPNLVQTLTNTLANIFDLTWKSGMQIILFLSGLQAIPATYYEVSSIEGANAWDSFWKITFPMVTPSILLVIVFTIIDTFTDVQNKIMKDITAEITKKILYGRASALAMLVFLLIGAFLGITMLIMRKSVFYND